MKQRRSPFRRAKLRQEMAALAESLVALPAPTPCAEDDRFTSDSDRDRAAVIPLCADCPILLTCRAAGRHERHGVWGGLDRTVGRPRSMYARVGTYHQPSNPHDRQEVPA